MQLASVAAVLAILSSCATADRPPAPAFSDTAVTSLLSEVCLPHVIDGKSEAEVVAGRGLRRDLSSSVLSHMRLQGGIGGNTYHGDHPDIRQLQINLRFRQCIISTFATLTTEDLLAQIDGALEPRREMWTHTETPYANVAAQGRWDLDRTGISVRYLVTSEGNVVVVHGSALPPNN